MDQFFEVALELPTKGARGAARILFEQLRIAIVEGRLSPGARLPAARTASTHFGVSRNTAANVYAQLVAGGYVAARRGSGTYVAKMLPTTVTKVKPRRASRVDRRLNAFWLRADVAGAMGFWRDTAQRPGVKAEVDLRPALVDWRLFPFDVFRRISAKALRGLQKKAVRNHSPQGNQGNYALRDSITKHIALTRSVPCGADEVIITSGAQQAFDLLARTLVTPGATVVAVEDPGYPPLRVAFAAAGAQLVPVKTDSEGLIVDQIPDSARIICICPSHQFPLGVTMSTARREALMAFARKRGASIIEDDYDGEFRYAGSFLKALRSAKTADSVFYVGTFSKCMLPAFRLGYVIAPDWAIAALVVAKNCLDWHCPTPIQLSVAEFISSGQLARHIRRMREIYRQRRALVLDAIDHRLADWLEPIPSFYGMHVAARARSKLKLTSAVEKLSSRQIAIHTFERYYFGAPQEAGFIVGYGAADLAQLDRGLSALRQVLSKV